MSPMIILPITPGLALATTISPAHAQEPTLEDFLLAEFFAC